DLADLDAGDPDEVVGLQAGHVGELGGVDLALAEPIIREHGQQREGAEQAEGQEDRQAPGGASQVTHASLLCPAASIVGGHGRGTSWPLVSGNAGPGPGGPGGTPGHSGPPPGPYSGAP